VPSEWAATPLVLSTETADHAGHINQGDVVRVVRGPKQDRTGHVKAKLSQGAVLSLSDVKTKEIVRFLTLVFS
jgi:hypothetical protein